MYKDMFGKYKLVLGLEIHIEPKTKRKMFCRCSADIWQAEPNTHTCPSCLGLPGALPVPNLEAIRKTQILGLTINCELNKHSRFDRKHYFYPDLPKGYQISQYKLPLCVGGYVDLDSGARVELERIHIEEDTAKSSHEGAKTLIDFNMSSMPLIEIVTTPCFKTIEDAAEFGKKIQTIMRALELGDADMEKGQMRLEPNISLRTQEMEDASELPNYKVEIKNINSFRFMEKAVTFEIKRQSELLQRGDVVIQENRGWDEIKNETISQRDKEDVHDYRYFPEPDIPPMHFDDSYFQHLKQTLPELPWIKKEKLVKQGLSLTAAATLANHTYLDLYNKYLIYISHGLDPVGTANALLNKVESRTLDESEFKSFLAKPAYELSENDVNHVIEENPQVVEQIKLGKETALEFLVGQVMKKNQGKAPAEQVRELLRKLIL